MLRIKLVLHGGILKFLEMAMLTRHSPGSLLVASYRETHSSKNVLE